MTLRNFTFISLLLSTLFAAQTHAQNWSGTTPGNIYYQQGRVGIGTSSPVSELDVNGNIALKYGGEIRVNVPDGDVSPWTINSNRTILKTSWSPVVGDYVDLKVPGAGINPTLIRLTQSGNIGFGVSEPTEALDVQGSVNARGNVIFERGSAIKIQPFAGGGNTPSQTHTIIENGWRHNQDYTSIHAAGLTSNTDASIVIKGDGNVGVGTTNPTSKLDIQGNVTARGDLYTEGSIQSNSDVVFQRGSAIKIQPFAGGGNTSSQTHTIIENGWRHNQDYTSIHAAGLTSNTDASIVIKGDGNVGVGTTNPTSKLDIQGNVTARGDLYTEGSIQSNSDVIFQRGSAIKIQPFTGGSNIASQTHTIIENGWRHNQDYTSIHAAGITGNSNAFIVIKGDGNVGIGTTDPHAKLTVDGPIRSKEVRVTANIDVPDYVFEEDYELRTLKATKAYIQQNKHLPEIPSAAEIEKDGMDVGEMNLRLLKKIEELTLYQIELQERIEKLEKQIEKE